MVLKMGNNETHRLIPSPLDAPLPNFQFIDVMSLLVCVAAFYFLFCFKDETVVVRTSRRRDKALAVAVQDDTHEPPVFEPLIYWIMISLPWKYMVGCYPPEDNLPGTGSTQ